MSTRKAREELSVPEVVMEEDYSEREMKEEEKPQVTHLVSRLHPGWCVRAPSACSISNHS